MAEAEPTLANTIESAPRGRMSRWWVCGPLLAVLLVAGGMLGWQAWKLHLFEKERMETPPHVLEDLKLKLLWIPAGTFTMGTEDEAEWLKSLKKKYNDVKPAGWREWKLSWVNHEETPATVVTLTKGFYLGETEVTQAQWESIMGNNPSEFKGDTSPVETVNWQDCVTFCSRLTARERAAGRLGPKQVYRLPTEAEWEYACRAGNLNEWSCGSDENRLGEFAWFKATAGGETHEVAMKRANDWGFRDMHGNVWEWCGDRFFAYPGGGVSDPTGAVTGSSRVLRGGSYCDSATDCRSAHRMNYSTTNRGPYLGFRLVLSSIP